jgi:hypothetical protein
MTGSTEFDVWNSRRAIPFYIAMAERTIQFDRLFMVDMIK